MPSRLRGHLQPATPAAQVSRTRPATHRGDEGEAACRSGSGRRGPGGSGEAGGRSRAAPSIGPAGNRGRRGLAGSLRHQERLGPRRHRNSLRGRRSLPRRPAGIGSAGGIEGAARADSRQATIVFGTAARVSVAAIALAPERGQSVRPGPRRRSRVLDDGILARPVSHGGTRCTQSGALRACACTRHRPRRGGRHRARAFARCGPRRSQSRQYFHHERGRDSGSRLRRRTRLARGPDSVRSDRSITDRDPALRESAGPRRPASRCPRRRVLARLPHVCAPQRQAPLRREYGARGPGTALATVAAGRAQPERMARSARGSRPSIASVGPPMSRYGWRRSTGAWQRRACRRC